MALDDTYFFAKAVIGFKDLTDHPHREMAEFIDWRQQRRRMLLAPRGTLKSSILRAWEIQMAMRNPNIRILHVMSAENVATKTSRLFDGIFRNNPMLKILFPDRIPDFNDRNITWNVQTKTIQRTKDYPEPTFMFVGVGTKVIGLHFDVIILDDFIELEAALSGDVMNSAIDYAAQCEPLLEDKRSEMVVVGTRWSLADYYGRVTGPRLCMSEKRLFRAEGDPKFIIMNRKCIEFGQPYWPQRFGIEQLAEIKASLDAQRKGWLFACNYMNNPVDESTCEFPRHMIRYYRWLDDDRLMLEMGDSAAPKTLGLGSLRLTMTVDPAFKQGKQFDESAISVVGSHPNGYRVNLYAWEGQVTPDILVAKIVDVYRYWEKRGKLIAKVAIEKVGGQRALSYYLKEVSWKLKLNMPIFWDLKTSTHKSKEDRIRGLTGFVAEGMWFTHRSFLKQNQQMETFPNAVSLNWLDALAYQPQIWGTSEYPALDDDDVGFDDDDAAPGAGDSSRRASGYGSAY